MNLPTNGRIAIIDDNVDQAIPLIEILSKKRLPFTYFSGEFNSLPLEEESNDIRVLFLDINLIDDAEHEIKVLKSKLIPVLKRVISTNNFPYVIIYWSRHVEHKNLIENDIFKNDLSDRRPIGFLNANKSDFFNFDGSKGDDFEENIASLFEKVNNLLGETPTYSYLINWENQVHKSTDKALDEIFQPINESKEHWSHNASYLIEKLGKGYLGKNYDGYSHEDKIKASFMPFNAVFKDTLEYTVNSTSVPNAQALAYDGRLVKTNVKLINEKLNLSKNILANNEPGCIVLYNFQHVQHENKFHEMLNKLISFFQLKNHLKEENSEINDVALNKLANGEHTRIKKEIKESWEKVAVVVTPICDFAQKNNRIYDRVIKGVLILSEYRKYIDNNSEAVYVVPFTINYEEKEYILVIDFRYFMTTDLLAEKNITSIFRIRQELLSEIQSRLSRHINRQGILFLEG